MTDETAAAGSRPQAPLDYELGFWGRGVQAVAGVDEVGRGPLAGPVVTAAVILRPGSSISGVTDSKLLTPEEREELHDLILDRAAAVAAGAASVGEIDRLNILEATALAMNRALARLPRTPEHVVVDGLPMKSLSREHDAVVGGDARVHSIACASIVAKVCRDRLMRRLDPRYPVYGWERNKGYGTPEHRAALREHGPSPHHRLTFGGIQFEFEL